MRLIFTLLLLMSFGFCLSQTKYSCDDVTLSISEIDVSTQKTDNKVIVYRIDSTYKKYGKMVYVCRIMPDDYHILITNKKLTSDTHLITTYEKEFKKETYMVCTKLED